MSATTRRAAVATVLALAVTVGVAGVGAAAHATGGQAVGEQRAAQEEPGPPDDRCDRGNSSENRNDAECDDDGGNSSIGVRLDVAGENPGGEGRYVCTGTPQRHECDKDGELAAGPVAVDYAGDNYANVTGLSGGGGDRFAVSGENRSGTVGFDCDFRRSTVADGPCSVTANSSEGGEGGAAPPATPTPPGAV